MSSTLKWKCFGFGLCSFSSLLIRLVNCLCNCSLSARNPNYVGTSLPVMKYHSSNGYNCERTELEIMLCYWQHALVERSCGYCMPFIHVSDCPITVFICVFDTFLPRMRFLVTKLRTLLHLGYWNAVLKRIELWQFQSSATGKYARIIRFLNTEIQWL